MLQAMLDRALDRLHGGYVFGRRTQILSDKLAALMPQGAAILDVGCGDGTIGQRILDKRSDTRLEGIDVYLRPQMAPGVSFRVNAFDGEHIPHADKSFDAVMFVDVLHHTKDPLTLLAEAARVARQCVVIKDHVRDGLLAEETLKAMDWVGNARHGVVLPYNYLNRLQWDATLERAGLEVASWDTSIGLYPGPAGWLFDRGLHCLIKAVPRRR